PDDALLGPVDGARQREGEAGFLGRGTEEAAGEAAGQRIAVARKRTGEKRPVASQCTRSGHPVEGSHGGAAVVVDREGVRDRSGPEIRGQGALHVGWAAEAGEGGGEALGGVGRGSGTRQIGKRRGRAEQERGRGVHIRYRIVLVQERKAQVVKLQGGVGGGGGGRQGGEPAPAIRGGGRSGDQAAGPGGRREQVGQAEARVRAAIAHGVGAAGVIGRHGDRALGGH